MGNIPPHEGRQPNGDGERRLQLLIGTQQKPLHGEDRLINRPELSLFGVVDGMGGHPDAKKVAELTHQAIIEYFTEHDAATIIKYGSLAMRLAFQHVGDVFRQAVAQGDASRDMGAVATAVYLYPDLEMGNRAQALYGHVGDTRLYVRRVQEGKMFRQTKDEGGARGLINYLSPVAYHLNQFGALELEPGDRLMLCSDGITGKAGFNQIDKNKFIDAFNMPTPGTAALHFIRASRVNDDKTVIVIDYNS